MKIIDEYKAKGYEPLQLYQITLAIENGLTKDQIDIIANINFNWMQMEQIRLGIEQGMDVSVYAHENIPADEMEHIREKYSINAGFDLKVKEETKLLKNQNRSKRIKIIVLILISILLISIILIGSIVGWNKIELLFDDIDLRVNQTTISVDYGTSINILDYIEFDERYPLDIIPDEIDTSHPGKINVVIQQSNGVITATKNMIINVNDHTAPVIELISYEIYYDAWSGCKAMVKNAYDEIDGDLKNDVCCDDNLEWIDGIAKVNYSVSDVVGNISSATLVVKQIPQCGANATWNGEDCVCNSGYTGDAWNGCTAEVKQPPVNTNNDSWNSNASSDGSWSSGGNSWVIEEQWSDWEIVEEETWSSSTSSEISDDVIVEFE